MVVGGEERVADRARFRIVFEPVRLALAPVEPDRCPPCARKGTPGLTVHVSAPARYVERAQRWRVAPYSLTHSASIVSLILSPTSTPPVSSATFHSSPQSLRLISVSALKPTRVSPHGDACEPRYSPFSVTGRVVSLHGEVAVERELAVAVVLDLGRAERRRSGASRRRRSRPSAGARRASGRRSRRPRRRSSRRPTTACGSSAMSRLAGGDGEAAADLGDHEVAGGERNVRVALVERVRSRPRGRCARLATGWWSWGLLRVIWRAQSVLDG